MCLLVLDLCVRMWNGDAVNNFQPRDGTWELGALPELTYQLAMPDPGGPGPEVHRQPVFWRSILVFARARAPAVARSRSSLPATLQPAFSSRSSFCGNGQIRTVRLVVICHMCHNSCLHNV